MKEAFKKIADFMGVFIPAVTFTVIFVTFCVTIISRYIFRTSVAWSYEISVLAYMWTMFFGVGKVLERDEHVVFGLVYDQLEEKSQLIFKIIYNLIIIILLCIVFVPSINSMLSKRFVTGVLKLPYTVVFSPFIYMLAETIIRCAINVYETIKRLKKINDFKQSSESRQVEVD